MPTIPTFNGCEVGNADTPSMVQAAGILDDSTKVLNSSSALPRITPWPQTIKGFLAFEIIAAAASTSDGLTTGIGL